MLIRKAKVQDIPVIHGLISSATQKGKILKRSAKDIRKSVRHFWVAEENGRVFACCAIEVYSKKLAEVRSLVVDPKRQGKGLASHLVEHCLGLARKKRIYEVLAITDRENLFKRLGFSEQLHGQKALFMRP